MLFTCGSSNIKQPILPPPEGGREDGSGFMVYGVGTGLVSTQKARKTPDAAFTAAELALIASRPSPDHARASRLAGKAAARAALRLPKEVPDAEIEILETPWGAPVLSLHGTAAQWAAERGAAGVELGLSGEERFCIAAAVAISD